MQDGAHPQPLYPIREAFAQVEAAAQAAEQERLAQERAAAAERAEQERLAREREADRLSLRAAFKRGGGGDNGLNMALRLGRALGWADEDIRAAIASKPRQPKQAGAAPRPADGWPEAGHDADDHGGGDGGGGGEPPPSPSDDEEGPRFVKKKNPIKPLRPDCPVIPLGVQGGHFHYLDPKGQLRSLKGKDHNAAGIRELFLDRVGWLWDAFPKFREKDNVQSGWKADEAGESLIHACGQKGVFNPLARVRGVGGWRDDKGQLILHCGDAVLINGEWRPPGEHDGYIYPGDDRTPRPLPDPAPRAVAQKLLQRLDSWNWRGEDEGGPQTDPEGHRLASILYLGWLASALAGAALSFRPVLWLTAEAGEGKTTLQELTQLVMSGGFIAASDATESGVSSSLGYSTKAVLLDENEDEGENRRVHALIKLARQAASGGSKLRGSSDHQAHAFNAKSSFMFASIIVPSLPPADASRIVILKMAPLKAGAARVRFDPEEWRHVGAGLRRRLVDGWPRWEATFNRYRAGLEKHSYNPRGLDQMGTLLAMADLMRWDAEPDTDTVELLCAAVAAQRKAEDYNPNNAQSMLNHLLSIPLDVFRGGERMTIGALVARAAGLDSDDKGQASYRSCQEALRAWSIYVDGLMEGATVTLPYIGEGLRKLFEGSHWRGVPGVKGGWAQAMERLPGAEAVNSRRIGGRGWRVPARTFLLLADGETLDGSSRPRQPEPPAQDDSGGLL